MSYGPWAPSPLVLRMVPIPRFSFASSSWVCRPRVTIVAMGLASERLKQGLLPTIQAFWGIPCPYSSSPFFPTVGWEGDEFD